MNLTYVQLAYTLDGTLRLNPLRWTPNPVPDEQCFEAIKAGIDALPPGAKMVMNSGLYSPALVSHDLYPHRQSITDDFYAQDWGIGNLQLLSRFYAK